MYKSMYVTIFNTSIWISDFDQDEYDIIVKLVEKSKLEFIKTTGQTVACTGTKDKLYTLLHLLTMYFNFEIS